MLLEKKEVSELRTQINKNANNVIRLPVELDSDTPLDQVQDELVAGGNVLQDLLVAVHPDAGAVLTAVQSIKSQLDDEGISDTWVTAHVRVGRETELIANTAVCQVSLSVKRPQ